MSFEPVSRKPSPLPNPDADGKLRILPLSDLHLPKSTSQQILSNRKYLAAMDYVVLMGDVCSAYGTDKEYEFARGFIAELDRPYGTITGNHEWYFQLFNEDNSLYGEVWSMAGREDQLRQLDKFLAFYQLDSLWRVQENELGVFLFLSIDTPKGVNPQTGHEADADQAVPSPGQPEALSLEQLLFLELQVRRAGDKPLYIFCHAPLMLHQRLDIVYYDEIRTGCVELVGELRDTFANREAPTYWMSGHVHLRPDHYLSRPYNLGRNLWQVHLPDSWGYGRWVREQRIPQRYSEVFSKHLVIDAEGVTIVAHNHATRQDIYEHRVEHWKK